MFHKTHVASDFKVIGLKFFWIFVLYRTATVRSVVDLQLLMQTLTKPFDQCSSDRTVQAHIIWHILFTQVHGGEDHDKEKPKRLKKSIVIHTDIGVFFCPLNLSIRAWKVFSMFPTNSERQ